MSVQVIDNFSYKGKKGNFERDNFDTLQAMRSYPEDGIDDGHVCFCNEDGNHYKFNHLNSVDGATGRWRLHNKSVNTLTETGEGKVLDARQGKILKDLIDAKVIEAGGVSFDTIPTKDSTNPVTSNGIREAMDEQAESINSNMGVDDYPVFSTSEAYPKGKVVNYNGKLYKFTADHAAGAWIGTDVEPYNLKKDIEERYGTYTDSPEFIRAYTDAEGKFLWGIRIDGSIEWAKGVPTPIQNALKELADKIKDLGGDKIEEIGTTLNEKIEALQDAIDVINASLKPLTDTFSIVSNDEWLHVVVDENDKILFGIKADGSPYYPNNEMYHVTQNSEYLAAWMDINNRLLFGIRYDGSIYIAKAEFLDKIDEILVCLEKTDWFDKTESEEYLAVETDSDGKVLSATNKDGSHYIRSVKSETIPDEFSHMEDKEGRLEMTLDNSNHIMSYRGKDGEKHESKMQVDRLRVGNVKLEGNSVNDLQNALIANGFNVKTPTDWSGSSFIQIPEPRFAIINVSGIDSMPTSKTQDLEAWLEFWDMQGNYFKKHAIVNAQGNSSMGFIKKNAAFDICDDEWIGDETPNIRFGNWVPQDSFHMKAYYTDFFRGVGAVSYKLYEEIVRTRGNMYDRPWKKALIDMGKIKETTSSFGNPIVDDYELQTDTGARCFPDGFPVACYLNGEFYGIFSWQLKKHRDNYHLDKKTPEHVHLDGTLSVANIFNGRENIDWTQFEVRNPKDLYAIGGNEYDSDKAMEELAGEDEVNAWIEAGQLPDGTEITSKIKETLRNTAKVKEYIENFADVIPTVKAAMSVYEASEKTEEDLRTFKDVYETYFDKDNMIDYMIVSDLVKNSDGFSKNWQWFTYDGVKWFVGLYDCDMSFGGHFQGNQITGVLTGHINTSTSLPNGYVVKYYKEEMESRYKELADMGIISADNIFGLLKDWTMRIGTSFYKEEYDRWADAPCISDSVVRTDYWELVYDDEGKPQTDASETFDATKAYAVGETASFGLNSTMGYFRFKCVKPTVALAANTPHTVSAYSPIRQFKHCDNIYRAERWIEKNTANMDALYGYTRVQ